MAETQTINGFLQQSQDALDNATQAATVYAKLVALVHKLDAGELVPEMLQDVGMAFHVGDISIPVALPSDPAELDAMLSATANKAASVLLNNLEEMSRIANSAVEYCQSAIDDASR